MADAINSIVEVYISRETAQIDTASFNIPLIMVNLPDTIDNTDPENPVNVPADVTERVTVHNSAASVADKYGEESIAYAMAQKLMGGDIRPAQFMVGVKNSSETYTQGLNAVMEYNNDWYALLLDSKVAGDIKEAAAVIQATRKMFFASTKDADVLDPVSTSDIGSFLHDGSYTRTALVYHQDADTQHPEAAWVGTQIVETPGSNDWCFKRGNGVTISRLSSTAQTALTEKRVNFFTRVGGVNMFRYGDTSEGSPIDEIIFVDWLQARMEEQIFYRIATKKKIPMTQAGAALIEAEIRSVLTQGQANGGIADAPQFQVQSPNVLAIPEDQRARRILGDFLFTARLSGSVRKVIVRGTVSY